MNEPECVVVIDAYSSGRYIAPEFARYGVSAVHVLERLASGLQDLDAFIVDEFTESLEWNSSVGAITRHLAEKWSPVAVIAGSDTGVETADALGAALGVRCNDPTTSALRRNKFAMTKAVAQRGLAPDQHLAGNLDEALTWVSEHGHWPIVAKPVQSSGSDNVAYCHSLDDVRSAFDRIFGRENMLGNVNENVLLQEYMDGPQFVLNAISHEGQHVFTDIWRIAQRSIEGAAMITDHKWSVCGDDPILPELVAYVEMVLSTCGIEYGASHTEIRMSGRGPVLIETAPRFMGASLEPEAFSAAFGRTQARLLARSVMDKQRFEDDLRRGYQHLQGIAIFHLNVPIEGTVCGIPGAMTIRTLPSFYAMFNIPKIGSKVIRTRINAANAGFIYLLNPDLDRLHKDIKLVREICWNNDLFSIAPS